MVQTIFVLRGRASIQSSPPMNAEEDNRWSTLSAVASAAAPEEANEVRSSRRERVLPSALVVEALRRLVLGAEEAFSAAASAASSASWTPVL